MKKSLTNRASLPRGKTATLLDIARSRYTTLATLIGREKGTPDIEAVHDIRVATRRLSQVVRLITSLMDKTSAKAVGHALKDLRRSSGALRDLDVMHEHFEKWSLPPSLGRVIDPMIKAYPKERAALVSDLEKNLDSVATQTAMKVLRNLLGYQLKIRQKTLLHIRHELCATADKRYRQFDQSLRRATQKQTPKKFHEARIAAKKLRYMLELAHEAGIRDMTQQLAFLKTMQADLGDMHDADVILETLKKRMAKQTLPMIKQSWADFRQRIKQEQSARASRFFAAVYQWSNDGQSHSL